MKSAINPQVIYREKLTEFAHKLSSSVVQIHCRDQSHPIAARFNEVDGVLEICCIACDRTLMRAAVGWAWANN